MIDIVWLMDALDVIKKGLADKLNKDNVTIYKVKNVIRVDIKEKENNE